MNQEIEKMKTIDDKAQHQLDEAENTKEQLRHAYTHKTETYDQDMQKQLDQYKQDLADREKANQSKYETEAEQSYQNDLADFQQTYGDHQDRIVDGLFHQVIEGEEDG